MTKRAKATSDEKPELRETLAPDATKTALHFLTFRIGDRQLAFPLEKVERVIRMAALVPVPEAQEWISGLLNLHGRVMPVISLRKRLGLSPKRAHPDHRILVMQTQNRKLGVIAETVEEVVAVSEDYFSKPGGTVKESPLLNAVIRKNDEVYLVLEADELDTGALIEFDESEANR
ncbi:MAG: chemotaxis protein CheW [Deltaproteobacteria bacterium]|nr:chemotaxis protein CheW [Deltaproteobacteria bacterium]